MKGKWALIRMGGKAANESKPNWLLIKEHDEFERGKDDPPITDEAPNSVVTGRSLDEIAKNEDHVWNSKETAKGNAWYRNDVKGSTPNGGASRKSCARNRTLSAVWGSKGEAAAVCYSGACVAGDDTTEWGRLVA